jgi:Domain of unknown function (DUF4361)/Domain of unknown function (DUF1735)
MKKIKLPIYLLLLCAVFSACLKEKHKIDIDDNTDRVITEFTSAKQGGASLALDFGTQVVEADLTEVRVLPRSAMSKDVQVKISENNALVIDAGYEPLPAGSYSIVAYDYTLTPSDRKANVRIKVNPSALVGGSYAVGLVIQQVSDGEISQVANEIVVEIKVKNDYEGDYHATGLRISYNGPTIGSGIAGQFPIDDDKYLYTIDQNTVETDVADLIGGGWMFLEVDPATFNVTVKPSTISPTFQLSNNGPCTYDPATRTFTLNYKYFNAAGNLRIITETIEAY